MLAFDNAMLAWQGMRKRLTIITASIALSLSFLSLFAVPVQAVGTWTTTPTCPNGDIIIMAWLLTDGSILGMGYGAGNQDWYKLTPGPDGDYVDGTWSQVASSPYGLLYGPQWVLGDGRFFYAGGEYFNGSSTPWFNDPNLSDANHSMIYDPVADSWSIGPDGLYTVIGDAGSAMLNDGRVLLSNANDSGMQIFNPATNTFTPSASFPVVPAGSHRPNSGDEQGFQLLPDGSVFAPYFSGTANDNNTPEPGYRYLPGSNQWAPTAVSPVPMFVAGEQGPVVTLQDGRIYCESEGNGTAFYTPPTTAQGLGSWTQGPGLPNGDVGGDTPGALEPDGKLLVCAAQGDNGPGDLFEYDPAANTFIGLTDPFTSGSTNQVAFVSFFLNLPNGKMLMMGFNNYFAEYTPDAGPVAGLRPAVTGVVANQDGTFTLTGTQLTGQSYGSSYGDDFTNSTNYPIVYLIDGQNVWHYCRSYGLSTHALSTGTTPVTTNFTLPAGLAQGTYGLYVSVNGIASATPFSFKYPFTVSTAPPAVTFSGLKTNQWYGSSDVDTHLKFQLTDLGGGIGGYSQKWDSDPGGSTPTSPGASSGYFTFGSIAAGSRDGSHTAFVRTYNSNDSQTKAFSSGPYKYDAVPPVVTLTGGATPGTSYATSQPVNFSISDSESGPKNYGAAWDTDPTPNTPGSSGSIATIPGTHTLNVRAVDAVGNSKDYTFGPFILDNTPPKVVITAPASYSTVQGTVNVTGTFSNPGGSGIASVQLLIDDNIVSPVSVTFTGNNNNGTFSYTWNTSGAGNGKHAITAKVTNNAGFLVAVQDIVYVTGSSSSSSTGSTGGTSSARFDSNGDGHNDLYFHNNQTGGLSRWLMNDQTVLQYGGTFATVSDTRYKMFSTLDINSDGHPDLFWWNSSTGAISVWTMNDQQVLNYGSTFATCSDTTWQPFATGEVRTNGNYNLYFYNVKSGSVSRWLMNGTTVLNYGSTIGTISDLNWAPMAVADFTNDGHDDLLFWNKSSGALSVWALNDQQVLSYGGTFATCGDTNWHPVSAADMNGDGHPDIVFENYATGAISRWLMNGTTVQQYGSTIGTISDLNWKITGEK